MNSIELTVAPHEVELASGLLWAGGVAGIEERSIDDTSVLLIAGVEPASVDDVCAAIGDRWPLHHGELHPEEFVDSWRPWARAVRVGDRLVLQPPWIDPIAHDGDLVVTVDPGRAWGHGAHPSTVLAAELLLERVGGRRILDVGCGSGVLAVVAATAGADHVEAIDIDGDAIAATTANAAANGVDDLIHATATPLGSVEGSFDVIVANIGCSVLCELAPSIVALAEVHATTRSVLVLSGLLDDQVAEVLEAYGALGWSECERRSTGGWSAVALSEVALSEVALPEVALAELS